MSLPITPINDQSITGSEFGFGPSPAIAECPLPLLEVPAVMVWGLPLARWTTDQAIDAVDRLIADPRPSLFITANLHYAMLSAADPRLRDVNRQAAFLLADGMPMVWYSRFSSAPLPERVAGSDLIYRLCQRAAARGYRVFLLGGAPGVADAAAAELTRRYPELKIVGVEAPDLHRLSPEEHSRLIGRVRQARADLLLVALGQPKGELWLGEHLDALRPRVAVQLGASFDFVAGRAVRAPRWMQRSGLEWFYRMVHEPRRLVPRYLENGLFLLRTVFRDLLARRAGRRECG